MAHPFVHWNDRIEAAQDETSQRTLLGEIGLWRARRLGDLTAQRDAAYALSVLYRKLGDHERAAHEAQQLLALCRTDPRPPREALRFVEQHAARTAARPKQGGGTSPAWHDALAAAADGRWGDARSAVRGRKGPKAALFRVWTELEEALATEGEAREAALRQVASRLARRFDAPAPTSTAESPAPPAGDSPLAALLGGPVPARRADLLQALDAHLEAHPDGIDALAAAALRDHVSRHGERAVAPWLLGYVVHALAATDGAATRAAIDALGDAYAITATREKAFRQVIDVARAGLAHGFRFAGARRGLGLRGVPDARRVWTLRLAKDDIVRLVAVGGPLDRDAKPGLAQRMARKLAQLERVVLAVLPGSGRAALRAALGEVGVPVLEDGVPAVIVAALAGLPVGDGPSSGAAPSPGSDDAGAPTAPEADSEGPPAADPRDAVVAAFTGDEVAGPEAYAASLAVLDATWRALPPLRKHFGDGSDPAVDARVAPLLRALHDGTPDDVRLAEALSLVVRIVARQPEGEVAALLAGDDAVAARYGAPTVRGLVPLVRRAMEAGWELERVLVGITRREARNRKGLGPIQKQVEGLWRAVLRRDGVRGELWWVDHPTPEAQAAAPLLLLDARPRTLVAAPGQGIEDWLAAPAGTERFVGNAIPDGALEDALAAWRNDEADASETGGADGAGASQAADATQATPVEDAPEGA